jgi:hypothetical protein
MPAHTSTLNGLTPTRLPQSDNGSIVRYFIFPLVDLLYPLKAKLPTWPLVYHTYTVWISTIFSWYPHRSLRKRRGRGQSCSHRVYTRLTHTILAFSRGVSPHESLPPRLVKSQLIHLAFQCKVVSRRSRWLSGDSPRRGHRELKPEV